MASTSSFNRHKQPPLKFIALTANLLSNYATISGTRKSFVANILLLWAAHSRSVSALRRGTKIKRANMALGFDNKPSNHKIRVPIISNGIVALIPIGGIEVFPILDQTEKGLAPADAPGEDVRRDTAIRVRGIRVCQRCVALAYIPGEKMVPRASVEKVV